MRVKLVQATPNAGKMITDIASICYGKEESKYPEKLLRHLLELGHQSTFEHVYFTFKIEGISRACLAQLTRHRHASFTVESQRYTENKGEVIIPTEIEINPIDKELYKDFTSLTFEYYQALLDRGFKKEDARFVLPEGSASNLYMSCNLRELIHLNSVRNTKQAQREIRDLVNEMTMLVAENSLELAFMFKED